MRRLAIDTSSTACTVALCDGDDLVERHEELAREHTRLLVPMIREVLNEADVALPELDAIVVGNGPGSFIGMRIAASVAQGLAHGAGLTVVPVSSLAAVAAEILESSAAERVAVAQDAHMNEVYLGLYSRGENGLPLAISDERLQAQESIAELKDSDEPFVVGGQGWERYPDLLKMNREWIDAGPSVLYPRASYLLSLSRLADGLDPSALQPAYLRQKVARKPTD